MLSPLQALRISAGLRVFAGLGLFVLGTMAIENLPHLSAFAILLMLVPGILLTSGGAGSFLRLGRLEQIQRERERLERGRGRAMDGLQAYVFNLLYAVAEADGPATRAEREMVRRFVLERFNDEETVTRLRQWNTPKVPAARVEATARSLRDVLAAPDREILFVSVCLVALVDERFSDPERALLQGIARGLNLSPAHARHLFHQARQQVLRQQRADSREAGGERQRALAVLGLGPTATLDDIRRRHRELAKRFHPDAHTQQGPNAVAVATQRFREVQRAYEVLRAM